MCLFTNQRLAGLPREYRSPGPKEKGDAPQPTTRAANSQGLESNLRELVLGYFMKPPTLEALGVIRPFGIFPLLPLLGSPVGWSNSSERKAYFVETIYCIS